MGGAEAINEHNTENEQDDNKPTIGFGDLAKQINSGNNLRKIFIENYGVEMEYPGYYLMDARFVPYDEKYLINLSWLINPSPSTLGTTTQTTFIDGTYKENAEEDEEGKKSKG